jgi:hypothetical protein
LRLELGTVTNYPFFGAVGAAAANGVIGYCPQFTPKWRGTKVHGWAEEAPGVRYQRKATHPGQDENRVAAGLAHGCFPIRK